MALINCPECGKEVSDKATICIYCGFPLSLTTNTTCKIGNESFDLSEYQMKLCSLSAESRNDLEYEFFNKVKTLTIFEVRELFDQITSTGQVPNFFNPHHVSKTAPRCPKCGSTAITTGARGVNWKLGLIGASKTVNRCANCGYTWKPKR